MGAGPRPATARRLLVLVVGVVGVAVAAVFLATAQRPAEHQGLTDLSLATIITAGLLDGLNPCAFGVLILFATFALGLAARQSLAPGGAARIADLGAASRTVLGLGGVFVLGVFLAYVLIGLGLLTALTAATSVASSHLPSRVAALIAIGLGLWMIRDVLLPDAGWQLAAPGVLHGRIRGWARTSSPLALFGGGILIGLCTVPCSGAVYLGVVALLSTGGTFASGLAGLLLYNVATITPLVLLLVLASRPGLIRRLNRWHLEHAVATKLGLALFVLALGFAILLTV